MIYLILKIAGYLVLALLTGLAAGWSLRHISAGRKDEEMERTLADARARVPQFETLIRSRDVQIGHLKEEIKDKSFRINALTDELRQAEAALAAREEGSGNGTGGPVSGEAGDADPVARLQRQLEEACAQAADAMAEAAAAESEVARLKTAAGQAAAVPPSEQDFQALEEANARLTQRAMEYERLSRDLEAEQRRVQELERERELQNKSLQVLHQQLELERERAQRAANG